MKYRIYLEAHGGVCDLEEETLGESEGDSPSQAIYNLIKEKGLTDLRWDYHFKCFRKGVIRKVLAQLMGPTNG